MGLFSNSLSLMESCLLVVILLVTVAVVFLIRLLIQTRKLKEKLSVFPEMPDRHWLLGHMHKVKSFKNVCYNSILPVLLYEQCSPFSDPLVKCQSERLRTSRNSL